MARNFERVIKMAYNNGTDSMGDQFEKKVNEAPEKIQKTIGNAKKAKKYSDRIKNAARKRKGHSAVRNGAKAAKAGAKAGAKAASGIVKILKAIGHFFVVTFPYGLLVVALFIVVLVLIELGPVTAFIHKVKEATLADIKKQIQATLGDTGDYRFQYNRLLPEQQYYYLYYGATPADGTSTSEQTLGIADLIAEAYDSALRCFRGNLGNLMLYHTTYFGADNLKSIDNVNPAWTASQIESYVSDVKVTEDMILYPQSYGSKNFEETYDYYSQRFFNTREGQNIVVLRNGKEYTVESGWDGTTYKGGFLDYFVFKPDDETETDNPEATEEEKKDSKEAPEITQRLVLNIDLTYLANHDTLCGSLLDIGGRKINKKSELTNLVTYIMSGANIATCEISPSTGYLDFFDKTIRKSDMFDQSKKFKSNGITLGSLWRRLFDGEQSLEEYSLFNKVKVKYKYNKKIKKETTGVLDTTSCEVVILPNTIYEGITGPLGEPVCQYYIKIADPVDTDRLLWSMLVSDAAKTTSYKGLQKYLCSPYQGSYYEAYTVFEPSNATINSTPLKLLDFLFGSGSADALINKTDLWAVTADRDGIRRYLYGLSEDDLANDKTKNYFKNLWEDAQNDSETFFAKLWRFSLTKNPAEFFKNYENSLNRQIDDLQNRYLVDKNNDGTLDYNDYTGILNESYYTYTMRPLYRCDANISKTDRHNLTHDGVYSISYCLYHKTFGPTAVWPGSNKKAPENVEDLILNEDGSVPDGICELCVSKSNPEAPVSDKGGLKCSEWASDYPPECPTCSALAQRQLFGKIKLEYIRAAKPEFTNMVTISEDEYWKKVVGKPKPSSSNSDGGVVADLGAYLLKVEGNKIMDLDTNYNRVGFANNWDESAANASHTLTVDGNDVTIDSNLAKEEAFSTEDSPRVYFDMTEFYGEYGVAHSFSSPESSVTNYFEGTKDLVEFSTDESKLEEFESRQEISADYNLKLYENWLKAKTGEIEGDSSAVPKYRALTLLNAIERRKYSYIMYLNSDSYDAGLFDESNGYEIPVSPINNMVITKEEIENKTFSEENKKEFDKEFSGEDESDTAFYYNG